MAVTERMIAAWRVRGTMCKRQREPATAISLAAFAAVERFHFATIDTLTRELESLGVPRSALRLDPLTELERMIMIADITSRLARGITTYNLLLFLRLPGRSITPTDTEVMQYFEDAGYRVDYGALACICPDKSVCAGHYGYTFTKK